MCSIILRIDERGVFIGANRDEMVARSWEAPGAYWPDLLGVVAGRDAVAGGTWLGMNSHGVVAAVLNRHGSLGPAAGKGSRGELPLIALAAATAEENAARIAALDAGHYRSFNLVVADAGGAYFLAGLEEGAPEMSALDPGTWMITSGQPNQMSLPRIARHLPKFAAAAFEDWPNLLADGTDPWDSALNISARGGFGTVCASVMALPQGGAPDWRFAAGPPDVAAFTPVTVAQFSPPAL
jgi:uncharacterized protein with NRDE domain